MENDKTSWATLLRKYLDEEITEEEQVELQNLMNQSPILKEQFEVVTAPDYFAKSIQTMLEAKDPKNLERGWKYVQKALKAAGKELK